MSTSALIAQKAEDGFRGIYLHSDGYIEHAGSILARYYNTAEKVSELIDLGHLSALDKNITPTLSTHKFDNPEKGVIIAYHRDRGDSFDEVAPIETGTLAELVELIDHDYLYVFEVV